MYGVCEGDFQFTLLHTEDTNGADLPLNAFNGACTPVNGSYVSFTRCNGGFARRATLIKQLRSQAQNSLLIDSSPFVRGKRKPSKCWSREMGLRHLRWKDEKRNSFAQIKCSHVLLPFESLVDQKKPKITPNCIFRHSIAVHFGTWGFGKVHICPGCVFCLIRSSQFVLSTSGFVLICLHFKAMTQSELMCCSSQHLQKRYMSATIWKPVKFYWLICTVFTWTSWQGSLQHAQILPLWLATSSELTLIRDLRMWQSSHSPYLTFLEVKRWRIDPSLYTCSIWLSHSLLPLSMTF